MAASGSELMAIDTNENIESAIGVSHIATLPCCCLRTTTENYSDRLILS
jgi:hypothetical protein